MSKPVPLVYYHGDCPDGTTSAWVLWTYFEGEVECVPLFYGKPFRKPEGLPRPVFMVDYCLKKHSEMKAIEQFAKPHKFIVIDHHDHETVKAAMAGLSHAIHIIGRSGARLTWEQVFPGRAAPAIVDYTEDRDLWRWKLKDSQEINAWLASFQLNDPAAWDLPATRLNRGSQTERIAIVREGATVLRFQEQCFKNAERRARLYNIPLPGGKTVRVRGANVAEKAFSSEVAGRLAGDNPLGFTWYVREDGMFTFSLRRRVADGPHMGEVARNLIKIIPGGRSAGGHPQAAGCEFDRLPIFLLGGYNEV